MRFFKCHGGYLLISFIYVVEMISNQSELLNLSQHFIYWLKLCEQLILNLYRRRKAVRVGRSVSPCLRVCCFVPAGCAAHSVAVGATSSCSHVDRVHLFCVIVTVFGGCASISDDKPKTEKQFSNLNICLFINTFQKISRSPMDVTLECFSGLWKSDNILDKPYSNKRDW